MLIKNFDLLIIIKNSDLIADLLVKNHTIIQFRFNVIKIVKNIMSIFFIISYLKLSKIIAREKI